jgi:tRNA(Arg) A34 adenosine deaminase TadA
MAASGSRDLLIVTNLEHERHMKRAIEIAHGNPDAPFGCVIVDAASDETLAEGLNNADASPILHGETDAILRLFENHPEVDPSSLVLYTTAEPCPMCSGAILWSGIPQVVLGTSINTLQKLGLPQIDLRCEEVAARASFGSFNVTRGVLETECDELFKPLARI